jgi:multiple sugar transport system ATP-binding protein
VAVGRAIVRQPAAFLFDEPLSNLDAKLRVEMRAELKALHRRLNTTTIYVTHDQEEAMTLGDRIVVMKDGIIQQCGAPLEVYDYPANRFVAGFVGMPPMNFFNGRLFSEDGKVWFDEGTCKIRLPEDKIDKFRDRIGSEVVLGVRPEAMALHGETRFGGGDNILPVKLTVVEPLGEKMDMIAKTDNHDHIVARVDAERGIRGGQEVKVYLDLQKIHVFDTGELGENLSTKVQEVAATS